MDPHYPHTLSQGDENYIHAAGYGTPYASDEDGGFGMQVYHQQMQPPYPVVQTGPQRQLSESEIQAMHYQRNLNIMGQPYANPVYNASPPHGAMPLSGSPPPPSPSHLYDPLSPPVSGSDTSADGIYHHSRNSSATGSPSSSRANSLVHRNPLRYNPTPSPTSSSTGGRRSRGRSLSDDDEGMGLGMAESLANTRKEATRRQRIEAEQRRRDELRDGYARLKDALPVSNQKSSKVSLLERATNYIIMMENQNRDLMKRLDAVEQEVKRLRALNEKISLSVGGTKSPSPSRITVDPHSSSPQPEASQLANIVGQEPPQDDSGSSPSDGEY